MRVVTETVWFGDIRTGEQFMRPARGEGVFTAHEVWVDNDGEDGHIKAHAEDGTFCVFDFGEGEEVRKVTVVFTAQPKEQFCACGHTSERHIECIDFTPATGCVEEECHCQRWAPAAA